MLPPSGDQYEITAGGYRAAVTESGAAPRLLEHEGRPLLDGFGGAAMPPGRRGQMLMPWPNPPRRRARRFGRRRPPAPPPRARGPAAARRLRRGRDATGRPRSDADAVAQPAARRRLLLRRPRPPAAAHRAEAPQRLPRARTLGRVEPGGAHRPLGVAV